MALIAFAGSTPHSLLWQKAHQGWMLFKRCDIALSATPSTHLI
jgi:hypothetical protein